MWKCNGYFKSDELCRYMWVKSWLEVLVVHCVRCGENILSRCA